MGDRFSACCCEFGYLDWWGPVVNRRAEDAVYRTRSVNEPSIGNELLIGRPVYRSASLLDTVWKYSWADPGGEIVYQFRIENSDPLNFSVINFDIAAGVAQWSHDLQSVFSRDVSGGLTRKRILGDFWRHGVTGNTTNMVVMAPPPHTNVVGFGAMNHFDSAGFTLTTVAVTSEGGHCLAFDKRNYLIAGALTIVGDVLSLKFGTFDTSTYKLATTLGTVTVNGTATDFVRAGIHSFSCDGSNVWALIWEDYDDGFSTSQRQYVVTNSGVVASYTLSGVSGSFVSTRYDQIIQIPGTTTAITSSRVSAGGGGTTPTLQVITSAGAISQSLVLKTGTTGNPVIAGVNEDWIYLYNCFPPTGANWTAGAHNTSTFNSWLMSPDLSVRVPSRVGPDGNGDFVDIRVFMDGRPPIGDRLAGYHDVIQNPPILPESPPAVYF